MMKDYSLVGIDGNAYNIMAYVIQAMKEQKYSKAEKDAYLEKAMSGDYDNLVMESMNMIDEINDKIAKEGY